MDPDPEPDPEHCFFW